MSIQKCEFNIISRNQGKFIFDILNSNGLQPIRLNLYVHLVDRLLFIRQLSRQHTFGNHINLENVLLNVVLEHKNEKSLVVKDPNVEEEVDVDRNVFEFQCQNVQQIKSHQMYKSAEMNVLLIGIQDRVVPIIIR